MYTTRMNVCVCVCVLRIKHVFYFTLKEKKNVLKNNFRNV